MKFWSRKSDFSAENRMMKLRVISTKLRKEQKRLLSADSMSKHLHGFTKHVRVYSLVAPKIVD